MDTIINSKLLRLQRGEPIRVLDLFSGCGGLTLGFVGTPSTNLRDGRQIGFVTVGGVELDELASQSYSADIRSRFQVLHVGNKMKFEQQMSMLETEVATEGPT